MNPSTIHPSSFIDEGAQIGEGTKVWHFCHIMSTAVIGKNCVLGQNVFIGDHVQLADSVKVQNNVSLYDGIICEHSVFIGPSVVFTNVLNPRSFIIRKDEYQKTKIKEGATIGANATILCGVEIGAYAFVGAGTVVTRNVPDYTLVTGNPARVKGFMSKAGYKLKFDDQGDGACPETGERYKLRGGKVSPLL